MGTVLDEKSHVNVNANLLLTQQALPILTQVKFYIMGARTDNNTDPTESAVSTWLFRLITVSTVL